MRSLRELSTLGACWLIVSSGVSAQAGLYQLPIHEHVFSNGLKLLVIERPGDHRVAAKIFTDFGAMVEEPGMLGAAHFLEHLMFKGTETLGTTDWASERPLVDSIRLVESELIDELNLERNTLRERGVFNDYAHARTTPRIDSLFETIKRLDSRASVYRDNGAMMRWYQAYGGQKLTATTEQEYMKFDINLPAARVELFFRIESDRMRNSVFREFEQERMILVEQRLGDLNRPTTPFYEEINATVGTIHPVFWPEGHATDFQQYTRAYERDLYERYFIPNNTTIVLIGGVRFDNMVSLVEQHFGWMARGPEPTRIRAVEPRPRAERRVVYHSDDLPPRVDVRHRIPGVGHPERPGLDVVAEVIRLTLRAELGAALPGAQSNVNTQVVHETRFGVSGTLNVEVSVDRAEELDIAEGTVIRTLDQIASVPTSPERLRLAKKKLRNAWFRTALDSDRLAFEIGHFQVMDRWQTLETYLTARERVSEEDVMRLAARYFTSENRTVGVAVPNNHLQAEVSGDARGR